MEVVANSGALHISKEEKKPNENENEISSIMCGSGPT